MQLKFNIEQVAICPTNPEAAIELLTAMGAGEWARDHVVATGSVFEQHGHVNEANLAFDYELLKGAREFEVLHYADGVNWMAAHGSGVSHLGMHCSAEELVEWRKFFAAREIGVAQEVDTLDHTNPVIAETRRYKYVIFNTRPILGVDVKFIVRKDIGGTVDPDASA